MQFSMLSLVLGGLKMSLHLLALYLQWPTLSLVVEASAVAADHPQNLNPQHLQRITSCPKNLIKIRILKMTNPTVQLIALKKATKSIGMNEWVLI